MQSGLYGATFLHTYQKLHVEELVFKSGPCLEAFSIQRLSLTLFLGVNAKRNALSANGGPFVSASPQHKLLERAVV